MCYWNYLYLPKYLICKKKKKLPFATVFEFSKKFSTKTECREQSQTTWYMNTGLAGAWTWVWQMRLLSMVHRLLVWDKALYMILERVSPPGIQFTGVLWLPYHKNTYILNVELLINTFLFNYTIFYYFFVTLVIHRKK